MARRTKRTGFLRPQEELETLRPTRDMLIGVHTHYPINSDAYRRAGEAMQAIDDLADALVGHSHYFWREQG